jgi:hypothetical protein
MYASKFSLPAVNVELLNIIASFPLLTSLPHCMMSVSSADNADGKTSPPQSAMPHQVQAS